MRPPGYRDQPGEYRTNIFTQTFTYFCVLVQQPCGVLPRRHHRGDEGGEDSRGSPRVGRQDPEDKQSETRTDESSRSPETRLQQMGSNTELCIKGYPGSVGPTSVDILNIMMIYYLLSTIYYVFDYKEYE